MQRRTLLEFGATWSLPHAIAQAQDRQKKRAANLHIGLTAVILADQAALLTRWCDYLGSRMGVPLAFVARKSDLL